MGDHGAAKSSLPHHLSHSNSGSHLHFHSDSDDDSNYGGGSSGGYYGNSTPPSPPKASAWDFINPFESIERYYTAYTPRRRDTRWKYDVFLSFRGPDTRKGITSELYDRLQRRGIKTFMDDPDLHVGDSITPSLVSAIEESRFAIVILSPNYASSPWCLDELVTIIRCNKEKGLRVMPVFYNVEPSDVRHQRGSFELKKKPQVDVEVREHEEVYGKNEDKFKAWRAALTEIANLSGWDSKNFRTEKELVEAIVGDIGSKVVYKSSSVDKGL